ncbi:hypothetical protein HMPREF0322_05149 [Desulfitobacterium hafniense DP7]|uniref:Uncharacterized protein n=1 Tax=Desulfitobacterium hafniense DP7 TaxID=537010 RepID=G9XVW6_DESHA|nr:hypothetical protein [Desulfitobacterium hafniense]EHL04229.1 hypothetical protein HMPREF0322_05149 [Desulfitobacterium hafniense DP7]
MKVLVIASSDADNWHIINICRELEYRGHTLTVYNAQNHEAVFRNLKAQIEPISKLDDKTLKNFDLALCGDVGAGYLLLRDIYVFVYEMSFIRFMPGAADFILRFWDGKDKRYSQRAAQIPIGNPKNDSIAFSKDTEKKRILYIDSGHLPFGHNGKAQIADMLLSMCHENPDYEVVIKPRWLRSQSTFLTHRNSEHIYDVIEERCNGEVPCNLNMLNEHLDLHDLIQSSCSVITLNSGAILDVLSYGKGLCIAGDYSQEDKYDMRLGKCEEERNFYARSGCVDTIAGIPKRMPHGIRSNGNFIREVLPSITGASAKAADVMEFVYEKFLKYGKYPAIKNYDSNTYALEMIDSGMSFDEIKQIRFENNAHKDLVLWQDFFKERLDFSETYKFIQSHYIDYPFTPEGRNEFIRECNLIKNKIVRANRDLLMCDAIDQDLLLRALYDTGYDDEILNIRQEEILAVGPHHFYTAQILRERGETEAAIKHYIIFLEEANSRSFEKYYTEVTHYGYKIAYTELFKLYDDKNVPPRKMSELIHALYESKRSHLIPYELHSRVYRNFYSEAAEELVEEESKPMYEAGKWIMSHEQFGKRFFQGRQISHLQDVIARQNREWFGIPHKLWGFLRCIREHGLRYTVKEYLFRRISRPFRTQVQLLRNFFREVMGGYQIYGRIMSEFGPRAYLYTTSYGTGDNYIMGNKYKAFCEKLPKEQQPIYVVYTKSGANIAKLFKIKDSAEINRDEYIKLFKLYMFIANTNARLFSFFPSTFSRHTTLYQGYFGYKGLPIHYYRYYAYSDIPDSEIRQPVFDKGGIDELFREYSLIPGRTVMLSPNAKSVSLLPTSFWEKLAHRLEQSGFIVCSNVAMDEHGHQQAEINGTIGIFVPYSILVPFLEKCGTLVSLRSGLSDVSESADCLNICLNGNNKKYINYYDSLAVCYNMKNYYGRSDMYDLIYTLRTEPALIEKIVKMVTEYAKKRS